MQSQITIVGRLAAAPEIRRTRSDKKVTTLRVLVDDFRLGNDPIAWEVDQWEDAADNAVKHLVKGQEISAEGHVDVRVWKTESGEPRATRKLERGVVFYGPKPRNHNTDDTATATA